MSTYCDECKGSGLTPDGNARCADCGGIGLVPETPSALQHENSRLARKVLDLQAELTRTRQLLEAERRRTSGTLLPESLKLS